MILQGANFGWSEFILGVSCGVVVSIFIYFLMLWLKKRRIIDDNNTNGTIMKTKTSKNKNEFSKEKPHNLTLIKHIFEGILSLDPNEAFNILNKYLDYVPELFFMDATRHPSYSMPMRIFDLLYSYSIYEIPSSEKKSYRIEVKRVESNEIVTKEEFAKYMVSKLDDEGVLSKTEVEVFEKFIQRRV